MLNFLLYFSVCVEDLIQYAHAFGLDEKSVLKSYVTWCVSSTALEPVVSADNLVIFIRKS